MRQGLLGIVAALAAVGSLSCADLGPSELVACGNGIVEPQNGEDCDGAQHCIAAGEPSACAWSCSAAECPLGFGCGDDKICRGHGYTLVRGSTIGVDRIAWVEAADFDGDGRDDVASVASGALDPVGNLSVAFLDGDATAERTYEWPGTRSRVTIADVVGDEGLDLVLTGEAGFAPSGAGRVLRNDGGRDFVPTVLVDGWTAVAEPNAVSIDEGLFSIDGAHLRPLYECEEEGCHLLDFSNVELPALKTNPATALATWGSFGEEVPLLFAAVTGAAKGGGLYEPKITVWEFFFDEDEDEEGISVKTLTFPAGAGNATGWVAYRDLNGDGVPDLLAQTQRTPESYIHSTIWVAFGAETDDECLAVPNSPCGFQMLVDPSALGCFDGPMCAGAPDDPNKLIGWRRPIAIEDLNEDGEVDFVFQSGLVISGPEGDCELVEDCEDECEDLSLCCTPEGATTSYDCQLHDNYSGPAYSWEPTAVVADITNDEQLDIVGIGEDGAKVVQAEQLPDGGFLDGVERRVEPTVTDLGVAFVDFDAEPDVVVRREGPGQADDEIVVFWGDEDAEAQSIVRDVELADGRWLGAFGVLVVERPGELGIAELVEAGAKRFASDLSSIGGDGDNFQLRGAVAGLFADPSRAELAVFGGGIGVDESDGPDGTGSEQAATVRMALDSPSGAYALDVATPWIDYATPGFYDLLPTFSSMGASLLAGDLDGDGRDELVVVAASAYEFDGVRATGVGDGLVTVHRRNGSAWTFVKDIMIAALPVGGSGPFVERPRQAELGDLDGDGDLDLLMIADASDGSRPYVVVPNKHASLALTPIVPPSSRSWDALSILSLDPEGVMRVAGVSDGELIVGALDPVTFELDERTTQTAPAGVTWSTVGDFDHDGLVDLGLATETGVAIYRGVVAEPQ